MSATREELVKELDRRVADKILERTNAEFLKKWISRADTDNEAMMIAELGTTYKRTGLHFDKRLEKMTDTIRYFKRNEGLSFRTDEAKPVNKLIIGDNYEALQNLLIAYRGRVNVIYIDPPYGKDKMGEFARTNYENAITRDNLLSMLYPRLELARELLAADGVIFCSIDDKNQAYVKCLFDEVFGEGNFVANFNWRKKTGANDAKDIAIITEYVLCYALNKAHTIESSIWCRDNNSRKESRFKFSDEFVDVRGKYYLDTLDRGGLSYSDSLNYGIETPDGGTIYPNDRDHYYNDGWIWKWGKDKIKWGLENKFLIFVKSDKSRASNYTIKYKVYEKVDNEGKIREDIGRAFSNLVLEPINKQGKTEISSIFKEENPFSNPKPIGLIQYLLRTVNSKSALVLDFFAGSGTTGHAKMSQT